MSGDVTKDECTSTGNVGSVTLGAMATTTKRAMPSPPLLVRALRANAGFSLLSGSTLLAGAPWLDNLLGPPS